MSTKMSDKCLTPIKLTIKIGKQSVVKSSINLDNESNDEELDSLSLNLDEEEDNDIERKDNSSADEEDVWLDALQEGRLHEVDEEKNNQNAIFICLPIDTAFDSMISTKGPNCRPLTPVKCARNGCHNNKKYSCSTTKLPLCSIECYKIVNK